MNLPPMPSVPPSNSVLWIYARQVIIFGMLLCFAAFAYQNKMDAKDIVMIATTMVSVLGLDVFKHVASQPDSTSTEAGGESLPTDLQ